MYMHAGEMCKEHTHTHEHTSTLLARTHACIPQNKCIRNQIFTTLYTLCKCTSLRKELHTAWSLSFGRRDTIWYLVHSLIKLKVVKLVKNSDFYNSEACFDVAIMRMIRSVSL